MTPLSRILLQTTATNRILKSFHTFHKLPNSTKLLINVKKNTVLYTSLRNDHDHDPGGQPGTNLPFTIGNKWRSTVMFCLFLGFPFWLPYLVVAYHLTK